MREPDPFEFVRNDIISATPGWQTAEYCTPEMNGAPERLFHYEDIIAWCINVSQQKDGTPWIHPHPITIDGVHDPEKLVIKSPNGCFYFSQHCKRDTEAEALEEAHDYFKS